MLLTQQAYHTDPYLLAPDVSHGRNQDLGPGTSTGWKYYRVDERDKSLIDLSGREACRRGVDLSGSVLCLSYPRLCASDQ